MNFCYLTHITLSLEEHYITLNFVLFTFSQKIFIIITRDIGLEGEYFSNSAAENRKLFSVSNNPIIIFLEYISDMIFSEQTKPLI